MVVDGNAGCYVFPDDQVYLERCNIRRSSSACNLSFPYFAGKEIRFGVTSHGETYLG